MNNQLTEITGGYLALNQPRLELFRSGVSHLRISRTFTSFPQRIASLPGVYVFHSESDTLPLLYR